MRFGEPIFCMNTWMSKVQRQMTQKLCKFCVHSAIRLEWMLSRRHHVGSRNWSTDFANWTSRQCVSCTTKFAPTPSAKEMDTLLSKILLFQPEIRMSSFQSLVEPDYEIVCMLHVNACHFCPMLLWMFVYNKVHIRYTTSFF